MKKTNSQIVFNARFAKALLNQGFPVIDIEHNHKNPNMLVFFFEKTPELTQALNALHKK